MSSTRTECTGTLDVVIQPPRQGRLVRVRPLRLQYANLKDGTVDSSQNKPPEPRNEVRSYAGVLLLTSQMLAQARQTLGCFVVFGMTLTILEGVY